MLINIKSIEKIKRILYAGCKWLYNENLGDVLSRCEYKNNVKKVIKIQKWMKKIIISKRLITLIPFLIPLYYDPECKGGYIHKKKMLIDL